MGENETPNSQNKEISVSNHNSFLSRLLDSVFIEQYEITTTLIAKFFWPVVVLILSISFNAELSTILSRLSKTTTLRFGGGEILIPSELLTVKDPDAYRIIQRLDREELEKILWLADSEVDLNSVTLSVDDRSVYEALEQEQLIYFTDYNDSTKVAFSSADLAKPTEMGLRVYAELKNIMISIIEETSKNPE